MTYEDSGTLRFNRESPTDESIEETGWSEADLQNVVDDNGIIRLPEAFSGVLWETNTDWNNAPQRSGVEIVNSTFQLAETTSTVSVIEDFESGDLSSYTTYGDPAVNTNSPVKEGSYSLKMDVDDSAQSTSGLDRYIRQDDVVRYWTQSSSGAVTLFAFFTQNENDRPPGYRVKLDYGGDQVVLQKDSDGGGPDTDLDTASVTLSGSTWYEVELTPESTGDITATLYDGSGSQLAQVVANDTEFTSGGIGFLHFISGEQSYFDYVRVVDTL